MDCPAEHYRVCPACGKTFDRYVRRATGEHMLRSRRPSDFCSDACRFAYHAEVRHLKTIFARQERAAEQARTDAAFVMRQRAIHASRRESPHE